MISAFQLVAFLHLLGAMILVGGQVAMTWLSWSPAVFGTDLAWRRVDKRFRVAAIVVLLATTLAGAGVARYTVISSALLTTTPYGPLLATKLSLAVVWLILLVFAPSPYRADGQRAGSARLWSTASSIVAFALVVVTSFLHQV